MQHKTHRTRHRIFLIILAILAVVSFACYQLFVATPSSNQKPQATPQTSNEPVSKPGTEITVSGGIGVTNCEHAGPGCDAVSVVDDDGKQWNLVLSGDQNQKIRSFKRVKVHGRIIHAANSDSIQVASYEQLQ